MRIMAISDLYGNLEGRDPSGAEVVVLPRAQGKKMIIVECQKCKLQRVNCGEKTT